MKAMDVPSPGEFTPCSRRRFLQLGGLGVLSIALSGCDDGQEDTRVQADFTSQDLVRRIHDPGAAAFFGKAYLQKAPQEGRSRLLVSAIAQSLSSQSSQITALDLMQRLDRQVRKEYATAEVVPIQGWLLSRTEARLYALAHLQLGS